MKKQSSSEEIEQTMFQTLGGSTDFDKVNKLVSIQLKLKSAASKLKAVDMIKEAKIVSEINDKLYMKNKIASKAIENPYKENKLSSNDIESIQTLFDDKNIWK